MTILDVLLMDINKVTTKSTKCNCIFVEDAKLCGVFIHQLPDDQISAFKTWLRGQTITTVCGQPFAYASDYEHWYDAWIKGEIAEVID